MWHWRCPNSPRVIWEFHSYKEMDESLRAHEDGSAIPGYRSFPPCDAEHEYWDDGVPCSIKRCKIPYVPEDWVFEHLTGNVD